MKKHIIAIISIVLAVCFTVYIALDTFVITYTYVVVDNKTESETTTTAETSETTTTTASTDAVITSDTYEDDNIKITITQYREYDTTIYVADVVLSSPDYLKTAFANGAYGKNVTASTSDIADSVDAILAINGDYYGSRESGYVIREGVLYRSTAAKNQEDLVIYEDGSFEIINESNITAQELLDKGAVNVFSFGPGLIEDGEITVDSSDEVAKSTSSNPRTAIGIIDDLHYCLVTADGRTSDEDGLSLLELAQFMESLGCEQAYNLDGGGSSTMVLNGTVINDPVGAGRGSSSGERSVSDIVYIGY